MFLNRSLPVQFVAWLLMLVTMVISVSEVSHIGSIGALLALMISSCASVMCGLLCVFTMVTFTIGIVVGLLTYGVGMNFTSHFNDFKPEDYGIHVEDMQ